MKYGSVCSGIEAASVAWHSLGWEAQWYSEIEHFPSEVLKHRFPDVPNLGDMTKLTSNPTFNEKSIDLLVGGTPCQSFSVAGLRGGLADPRGNLMLTFLALADAKKPKWIVWENVPGVLSSNGGKDFGTFLGALGELGYGFAYRVLDAQHFGVAQRRRRVFVVGYLGDWRPAAAVLFESESLQRDSKPSRTKRQETPYDAQKCVGTTSPDGRETIGTLRQRDYKGIGNDDLESGRGLDIQIKDVSCAGGNVSPTVTSKWKTGYGKPSGRSEADNMVYEPQYFDNHAQDSRVTGPHDVGSTVSANYGMGGGNTPIVGQPTAQPIALASKQYSQNIGNNIANPLLADDYKEPQVIAQLIAYSFDSLSSNSMKSNNPHSGCREVDTSKTIDTTTPEPSKNQGGIAIAQPIMLDDQGGSVMNVSQSGICGTLRRETHGHEPLIAQPIQICFNDANGTRKDRPNGGCYITENPQVSPTVTQAESDLKVIQPVAQPVHAFKVRGGSETETGEQGGTPGKKAGKGYLGQDEKAFTIGATQDQQIAQPIAVDVYNQTIDGQTSATITKAVGGTNTSGPKIAQPIAVDCFKQTINNKTSQTIGSSASDVNHYGAVLEPTIIDRAAFNQGEKAQYEPRIEQGQTMSSLVAKGPHAVKHTMAIRRLTPKECERLQGFPDDWTKIPYRNKPADQCPDGPRYKACGNSMAVPVMRWIGQRIEYIESLMKEL